MLLTFLALALGLFLLTVFAGLGPFLLGARRLPKTGLSALGLCAAFGSGVLGGAATYVFDLELRPGWTLLIALLVSAGGTLYAFIRAPAAAAATLRDLVRSLGVDLDFLAALLVLMACVFHAGYWGGFGQPYRFGIDQVGYSVTADYLQQGGTRSALRSAIVRATQQPTLETALNANITAISFNEDVAAEFLLKAHRIAYPMLLAGLGQAFGLNPIVKYQFCILGAAWITGAMVALWFAADILGLARPVAKAIAIGLAMNCNQLDVLFEGQHAQIFAAPLFVVFFALLYLWREPAAEGGSHALFLPVMVTGAGIFALYSDSFLALVFSGVVLLGLDLVCLDLKALGRTALFPLAVVCGMALLGGYFYNWVSFILRHLANVAGGHGGWSQPHWAFPAEILGYASIYSTPSLNLLGRSSADAAVEGVAVAVLLTALVYAWPRIPPRQWRYWCAPALVCTFVFVQLRYVHHYHNYSYMKTYTMLLAALVMFHWLVLAKVAERLVQRSSSLRLPLEVGMALLALGVTFVGTRDALRFTQEARRLPRDVEQLRAFDANRDLSSFAILTYPESGLPCATLGAYFRLNWLNLDWADKRLGPNQNKEVMVLVFRDAYPASSLLVHSQKVALATASFILLRTGVTVAQLGLPELNFVADQATTAIVWPKKQRSKETAFLEQFVVRESGW